MTEKSRQRMRFETEEAIMRAVRARAGMEGVDTNAIINQAIEAYLPKEIAEARERIAKSQRTTDKKKT